MDFTDEEIAAEFASEQLRGHRLELSDFELETHGDQPSAFTARVVDPVAVAAANRRWWGTRPGKAAEYQRKWRAKNPELAKEAMRRDARARYKKHPEKCKARARKAYYKRRDRHRLWKLVWLGVLLSPTAAENAGLEVPAPRQRRRSGPKAPQSRRAPRG